MLAKFLWINDWFDSVLETQEKKDLIRRISDNRKTLTKFAIQSRLKRRTHQVRFGDIREIHGTLLTRYLGVGEIDFLHGRVSTGVFMRNYFNPALIGDLQARALKGILEIEGKVKA